MRRYQVQLLAGAREHSLLHLEEIGKFLGISSIDYQPLDTSHKQFSVGRIFASFNWFTKV